MGWEGAQQEAPGELVQGQCAAQHWHTGLWIELHPQGMPAPLMGFINVCFCVCLRDRYQVSVSVPSGTSGQ